MINQDRVRQMSRLAIQEKSVKGQKALRVCASKRIDYVIIQLVKSFFAGSVCYFACCALWLALSWDNLNYIFRDAQYMQFLQDVLKRYVIFLIIYLIICGLAFVVYYNRCKKRRNKFYKGLTWLAKSYAEDGPSEEEDEEEEDDL